MRRNLYSYGLGALALLAGGGLAAYAALAETPKVTQQAPAAIGQTPLDPTVEAQFAYDLDTPACFIDITVTAPSKARGDDWITRPVDKWDRVELYRTLDDEDPVLINTWNDVDAGAKLTYRDAETLEYRGDYTYSAKAFLNGTAGESGRKDIVYGINPVEPPTPKCEVEGLEGPVSIAYACGTADSGSLWDSTPFPADISYTLIELYKYNADGALELLDSHQNPAPEQEFTFVDEKPLSGQNTYLVYTYTLFGKSSASRQFAYVGEDTPGKVTNVVAIETNGTVTVTWTAPAEGFHGGLLDPSKLVYKIYRSEDNSFHNPTLLADAVTECRYVDKLEGVDGEKTLFYRVQPENGIPFDEIGYNYGETAYGVIAGPPTPLPFSENFNGGHKMNRTTQNNWEEDFGYAFGSHYLRSDVTVENAGEDQSITCGVDGPGNQETGPDNFFFVSTSSWSSSTEAGTLTSGNLSFADAVNPIASFWYVPVAGSTGCVALQMATGETDSNGQPIFETVISQPCGELPSGEKAETGVKMEWTKVSAPLTSLVGKHASKVRIAFNYNDPEEGRYPMLLDQIEINDYPGATGLTVTPDEEKIMLSWNLPATAAGKEVTFGIILNGETIATTEETSYLFEGAEQGDTYEFAVATSYADGVEGPVAEAEPVAIPITDFVADNFYFVVNDNHDAVSLQAYLANDTEVTVPAEITYKNVTFPITHMLPSMFSGRRTLKSLEIKAPLDYVNDKMCYGCVALESVKLPETVDAIGVQAFFGCSALAEIEIPASVTVIESAAFQNCIKLSEITIGANIAEIQEEAFKRCQQLSKVTFESPVPPVVGTDAFSGIAEGCVGECPEGSEDAYKAVAELSPISFPSAGVDAVVAGEAVEITLYNAAGIRIAKPVSGETVIVRIRRADGSVETSKQIAR